VLDPALALEEHYDVLVVSHRWPGLTHRLVAALADSGRSVLGVFDPDEPAGRDHLVALGVCHVVAADAPVASFVELLDELPRARGGDGRPVTRTRDRATDLTTLPHATVVVTGAPGAGVTEVALALAHACALRRVTVLVDARERGAALAVRLGLAVEPAMRDAVDAVEHATGLLTDTLTRVAPRFDVLPGLAAGALTPVATHEVRNVVGALVDTGRAVVVDASAGEGTGRALIADAAAVVFVACASPTGVAHTLAWASEHPALFPSRAAVLLNRAPRERFRRGELERELVRTLGVETAVWFAPSDARVDDAAWDGGLVRRGPFVATVERLAAAVATAPRHHDRVPRRRRARSAA
jgi:Mrp family chromosome partitioning ATPase